MSIRRPNHKQRKYAFNIMNTDSTKGQAALDAGYSESASRVPARIEASKGFHIAMATLAMNTGNVAMNVLHTLQHRDMSKESTDTLLSAVSTLSNAWTKFVPRENNPIDTTLDTIFAGTAEEVITATQDTLDTSQDL